MKRIAIEKEKWIVRKYLAGMPAKRIAAHQQISIRAVYKKIQNYKKLGEKFFEISLRGEERSR